MSPGKYRYWQFNELKPRTPFAFVETQIFEIYRFSKFKALPRMKVLTKSSLQYWTITRHPDWGWNIPAWNDGQTLLCFCHWICKAWGGGITMWHMHVPIHSYFKIKAHICKREYKHRLKFEKHFQNTLYVINTVALLLRWKTF